jgi:hypothetical protein
LHRALWTSLPGGDSAEAAASASNWRDERLPTMSVFDYLRNSEQSIYDFNTPWSMAIVVLGFLSAWLVSNILEHLGITRHVWHLPLFFAALAVLFGSLIGLFFAP